MKRNFTTKYEGLSLINRWKQKKHSRNCDWVIFGIQEWYSSPYDFCIKLCFFGIDLHIWFEKSFK
jgi:hypothetical protein